MKRTTSALAALALAASLAGTGARSADAAGVTASGGAVRAATCHGLAATIVGHGRVIGTDGPDVIVTNGPASVDSLAGDDTICLRGHGTPPDGFEYVYAGSGDDYVVNQLTGYQGAHATLGSGNNTYLGGDDEDLVTLIGDQGPTTNTVSTFGGSDLVETGQSGLVNHDHIDTGDGPDTIDVRAIDNSQAMWRGGRGHDRLTAMLPGVPQGAWVFDNKAGVATLDGTLMARWSGLEDFGMAAFGGSSQKFVGSGKSEQVYLAARGGLSFDMGGGDDTIYVEHYGPVDGVIRGGTGSDLLVAIEFRDSVKTEASLESQTVHFTELPGYTAPPLPDTDWKLGGINSMELQSPLVRLTGDQEANTLTGVGCDVRISGGSGGDTITTSPVPSYYVDFHCDTPQTSTLRGELGNDRLTGAYRRDTLIGGDGWDHADGRGGKDVCRAEVETNCEYT